MFITSFTQAITYDHSGRLLTNLHKVNGSISATLSYDYDELGRLTGITRSNGSKSLTTTNQYNLRGWLTASVNPLFTQHLYYTNGTGTPCYNGNISSMTWKAGKEATTHGYRFTYDQLSRLKNAMYGEGETLSPVPYRYDEQITGYDKNGNILGLKRYGQTSTSGYGLIDDLTMTLNGNQLTSVNDAATALPYNNGFEFKDNSKLSTEYTYDDNGNLTKDLNKRITDIQYNYLNLPDRIEFEGGSYVAYRYDAAGKKLKAVHYNAGNTTTTDYCGSVIFENGTPKTVLTEAGFVSLNDNKYHYYLQDHQGNNRIVADQNGNVEEVNHYYPFGGIFANNASIQPYKYNGKELDTKNGLNWYDYGARQYDAAIGRWQVVDPMAEKYYSNSPYTYCANNPMRFIDPTGMFYGDYYSGYTGKFLFSDGIKDNKVYVRNVTSIVGNELIYEDTQVGTKNNIPDKTNVFNAFLKKTNDYFTEMNQNLEKKESKILMGGIGKYKRKLAAFRELVTDEAPFDIKNAEGGEFSTKNKKAFKNKYAFYDGKLLRYDDFGNFNYGVAGKAFGLSEFILQVGAGINQLSKPNVPHSILSYGDEDKDNYMIRQGFEYYNKHFKE